MISSVPRFINESSWELIISSRETRRSRLWPKFEDDVPLSYQDEHGALGDENPDSGVSEGEGLGDRATANISLKSSEGD